MVGKQLPCSAFTASELVHKGKRTPFGGPTAESVEESPFKEK